MESTDLKGWPFQVGKSRGQEGWFTPPDWEYESAGVNHPSNLQILVTQVIHNNLDGLV